MNTMPPAIRLIIQYDALMLRYCRRLLGGNASLANKIVQQSMEQVYEAGSFHPSPGFRSLLQKTVRENAAAHRSPTRQNTTL